MQEIHYIFIYVNQLHAHGVNIPINNPGHYIRFT